MTTILFWGLLAAMTIMALAFILVPLLRSRTLREVSRREVNVALYRERLREIEQAQAAGDCSAAEAAAAKTELQARLVGDVGQPVAGTSVAAPVQRRIVGLLLLVLLPGLAVGVYLNTGDWRLALAGNGSATIDLLMQRLERHLDQVPGDVQGWRLLARSNMQLRHFEAAARAFARLNELESSADGLIGEAEALAMAAGGSLQGRPEALIKQALQLEPESVTAQWYAGMAAWQRGDGKGALGYWNRVARQELPGDFRKMLDAQIVQAGGSPPVAPQHFQITVEVVLDPQLAGQVTAAMPLFIYARAAGQGGPPLAVARRSVADLPLTVSLDDSQSMLPDRKLSSVDRWLITARVARQGSADRRSGDLYAEAEVTRQALPAPVKLIINRIVP